MIKSKIIFVLLLVFCSCSAMPDPKAEFEMNMHFSDKGDDHHNGDGDDEDTCQDMCVMREPYWGDCPSDMHHAPGRCDHPHDYICCKMNPICGNEAQGRCYRSNATTDGCPLPLFRQSTRRSIPCHHGSTCCANEADPHCNCGHWGYVGMCGERGWTSLCSDFCDGDKQSPINIETAEMAHKGAGSWNLTDYDKPFAHITCENNGHFAVCHFDTSTVMPKVSGHGIDGEYIFDHLVFHIGCEDGMGSEHTVDGMSYSGEVHLIHFSSHYDNYTHALHSSDPVAIGVLGVFLHVNETEGSAVYDPFMDNLVYINKRYEHKTFAFGHPLRAFLPASLDTFYTYKGSLTHPSCNEVVQWAIFAEQAIIGEYQIRPFRCMMEGHGDHMCDNHRPTQPLNGRMVHEYHS